MKTIKILSILLILSILSNIINAQNITADTTLANKHFETAKEYFKNKSYDTAIVCYEKASILYEKHKLWRRYLLSETRHGECFQKQWQIDKAIATIKPAIEKTLLYINENDTIVADAYNIFGVQYYYQSINDSTLFYWKKALKIRKKILSENHIKVAHSYNNIGIVYWNKSEYDLALQYYFKSLQIKRELFGEKHTSVASSYNNVGIIYFDKNEYDLALQYYFRSLQIRKELLGEKHILLAGNYNNIGVVYNDKNEYDLALEYYLKALQIRKELLGEKHTSVALNYNNIGIVYYDKKEYDLALEYHFKALQIRKELLGEKHTDAADSYNNIGAVYTYKNEYDLALEYYFKSLQIRKELLGEKHTEVSKCYNNIGFVYNSKNKYDLALQYYFKNIKLYKELLGEKHILEAENYYNIGDVYLNKSENVQALQYYQKAIAASLRNFNDTVNVYSVPLINDYLNWDYLLEALQTKAKIFADMNITLPKFQTSAKLEISLRHYQACDTLISQVRKDMKTKSDKIALGTIASEVYKGAVDVCKTLSEFQNSDMVRYNQLAFYFSEKNKSSVLLESLAGAEAQKFAGIPDTLLKKENKLQIDIALYKKVLAEESDSLTETRFQDKLFKANRSYDSLITVFENNYPEYYELKYNQNLATVDQISNLFDKKTAIISYFTGDSTIIIFTVKKKKFYVTSTAKPADFEGKIESLRYNISNTALIASEYKPNSHESVDGYQKAAYELYEILFPPKVKDALGKKMENLIIIPDGKLATLPFEVLHTRKYTATWTDWENKAYFSEMPYLVKDYNISYTYSGNLFYKSFNKTDKQKDIEITELNDWLAFAPVFDNENISGTAMRTRKLLKKVEETTPDSIKTRVFTRDGMYISELPGSLSETQSIFKLFERQDKKALLKTHLMANEEFIKSGELEKYRYLHFATHGIVNEEKPELSGLILAQDTLCKEDNILFAGEIYNLKLNADLTVMSACETGLGKITEGEGVIGLTRALLYAGTKNIIVSLWQVSDNSTNELMVNFYENFLRDKPSGVFKTRKHFSNYSNHLQKAKLKLIKESKYAHPFFWSPFILIGR